MGLRTGIKYYGSPLSVALETLSLVEQVPEDYSRSFEVFWALALRRHITLLQKGEAKEKSSADTVTLGYKVHSMEVR